MGRQALEGIFEIFKTILSDFLKIQARAGCLAIFLNRIYLAMNGYIDIFVFGDTHCIGLF
jgi:hypothetical protein